MTNVRQRVLVICVFDTLLLTLTVTATMIVPNDCSKAQRLPLYRSRVPGRQIIEATTECTAGLKPLTLFHVMNDSCGIPRESKIAALIRLQREKQKSIRYYEICTADLMHTHTHITKVVTTHVTEHDRH